MPLMPRMFVASNILLVFLVDGKQKDIKTKKLNARKFLKPGSATKAICNIPKPVYPTLL